MPCWGRQMCLLSLGIHLLICWLETVALPSGLNTRYVKAATEPTVRWRQQLIQTAGAAALGAEQPATNQSSGDEASRTTFTALTQHNRRSKTNNYSSEPEVNVSQLHQDASTPIRRQDKGFEPQGNIQASDVSPGASPPVSQESSGSSAKAVVAVIIVIGIVVLVGLMHFRVCAEIGQQVSCCDSTKHGPLSQSTDDELHVGVSDNHETATGAGDVLNLTPLSGKESCRAWTLRVIHKLVNGRSVYGRTIIPSSYELVRVARRDAGRERQL